MRLQLQEKYKALNTLVTTTLTNEGTSNMNSTKPTRDLWYKAHTIGMAASALLKATELAVTHTHALDIATIGIKHCYTCVLIIWMIATHILM